VPVRPAIVAVMQNGYGVVTDELTGYVRRTRKLADELHQLATHTVRSVGTIAEDSFGQIGKETGFAAALRRFAATLEQQVGGVATNAGTLGDAVGKTAHTYQRQDDELAKDILDLLR
jgi:hypothetical protein